MRQTFTSALLGLVLMATSAGASSQLERSLGVPAGAFTLNELATIHLKSHNDRANERRTVIYRDRADRHWLEPLLKERLGPWSDIVIVWR